MGNVHTAETSIALINLIHEEGNASYTDLLNSIRDNGGLEGVGNGYVDDLDIPVTLVINHYSSKISGPVIEPVPSLNKTQSRIFQEYMEDKDEEWTSTEHEIFARIPWQFTSTWKDRHEEIEVLDSVML